MESQERLNFFKNELNYIYNPRIRDFAEKALCSLPDYFFEIPASSTGKYHPSYSLGTGGLARHTRSAIRIAIELFRMDWFNFSNDEKDLIISALLVHDGYKSGTIQEVYTRTDHPLLCSFAVLHNTELAEILSEEEMEIVRLCIARHMGQWTKDYKSGEEVLERPQSKFEKFVHLADYLASRKCLEMNFDVSVMRE